jgi:hypothetical protein
MPRLPAMPSTLARYRTPAEAGGRRDRRVTRPRQGAWIAEHHKAEYQKPEAPRDKRCRITPSRTVSGSTTHPRRRSTFASRKNRQAHVCTHLKTEFSLITRFPPQHLIEEAFPRNEARTLQPGSVPVKGLLSQPSRLVCRKSPLALLSLDRPRSIASGAPRELCTGVSIEPQVWLHGRRDVLPAEHQEILRRAVHRNHHAVRKPRS